MVKGRNEVHVVFAARNELEEPSILILNFTFLQTYSSPDAESDLFHARLLRIVDGDPVADPLILVSVSSLRSTARSGVHSSSLPSIDI